MATPVSRQTNPAHYPRDHRMTSSPELSGAAQVDSCLIELVNHIDEMGDADPFRIGDLEIEFAAAVAAVRRNDVSLAWLKASPAAPGLAATGFGFATVRIFDGMWSPGNDVGRPFLILPTYDRGVLADLFAFSPRAPASIWPRRGGLDWLNPDAVTAAQGGWSIRLYETAWGWLCAGAPPDGAVPLQDSAMAALQRSGPIECETPQLARRLRAAITSAYERRMPGITVRQAA
ncbi:hypothetical protein QFZ27_004472 [Inquilinus ginsengisoli]|uniref:hypothetical protein n=1 Tax=Inquilinus ginsengisoli TaxID=363840 RepID=UPI003D22111E